MDDFAHNFVSFRENDRLPTYSGLPNWCISTGATLLGEGKGVQFKMAAFSDDGERRDFVMTRPLEATTRFHLLREEPALIRAGLEAMGLWDGAAPSPGVG